MSGVDEAWSYNALHFPINFQWIHLLDETFKVRRTKTEFLLNGKHAIYNTIRPFDIYVHYIYIYIYIIKPNNTTWFCFLYKWYCY